MKNNKTIKLAIFLLALTMIAVMFVSGTFAKYTSQVTGSSSVTVAKWSIGVIIDGDTTEIAVSPATTIDFDLFTTINDTLDHNDEEDVDDDLIAPGTEGSFTLQIENSSEVTAKYGIAFTVTNTSSVPIEFSTDGTNWTSNLASLNVDIEDDDSVIDMGDTTDEITVQWRWPYERGNATPDIAANDVVDTNLGIAAQTTAPQVTVSATITATQVD